MASSNNNSTIEAPPISIPPTYTPGGVEWLWLAIAASASWVVPKLWSWFTSKDQVEDKRTDGLIELLTRTFQQQSQSVQDSLKEMASHLSSLTRSQVDMVRTLQDSHMTIRSEAERGQQSITTLAESATKAINSHQSQIEALMRTQTAVYVELTEKISEVGSLVKALHDRLDQGKYQAPPPQHGNEKL